MTEARERLRKAGRMVQQGKEAAFDDPDLKAIWGTIESMKFARQGTLSLSFLLLSP